MLHRVSLRSAAVPAAPAAQQKPAPNHVAFFLKQAREGHSTIFGRVVDDIEVGQAISAGVTERVDIA